MTSQAQAQAPLDAVRGLVFFGFPLHAAGKPSDQRAAHLFQVAVPMLFLQGSKDKLAELALLEPLLDKLGRKASLHIAGMPIIPFTSRPVRAAATLMSWLKSSMRLPHGSAS